MCRRSCNTTSNRSADRKCRCHENSDRKRNYRADDAAGDLVGVDGRVVPGLAVSPILGRLHRIFGHATDLEIQMLTSLPSLLIIPSCCWPESFRSAGTSC